MAVGQYVAFVGLGVPLDADTPEAAAARQILAGAPSVLVEIDGSVDVEAEQAGEATPVEAVEPRPRRQRRQ